jgi:hypothetical protein
VILSRCKFLALIARNVLIGGGLQIHSVQGQAVEGTEKLTLIVGIHSLNHLHVTCGILAPGARYSLGILTLELFQTFVRANVFDIAFELDGLGLSI